MSRLPAPLRRDLEPLWALLHGEAPDVVLPVVGSGLSSPLPSWRTLLLDLTKRAPVAERRLLKQKLSKDQFLEVAEALEGLTEVGPERIAEEVRRCYQRPAGDRPVAYDLVAQLPVKHFATTNFDPWLKNAVAVHKNGVPRVCVPGDEGAFRELSVISPPAVMMLHGDADNAERCVLSTRAYRRLVHGDAAFKDALQALVAQRRWLFIGYSLSDPDILSALERWREVFGRADSAGAPPHFYLGAGLDRLREQWLLERGILPIDYGRHATSATNAHHLLPAVLRHLIAARRPARSKSTAGKRRAAATARGRRSAVPRPKPSRSPSVAVLAVLGEMGEVSQAVRDALSQAFGHVELLDAEADTAVVRPKEPSFVVALVGARLGHPGLFEALLESQDAAVLRIERFDPTQTDPTELPAVIGLHRRVPTKFIDAQDAARQAQPLVADWLRLHAPDAATRRAQLADWERAYLLAKIDEWAGSRHGPLSAYAGERDVRRVALYVSLHAQPQPWCHLGDDGTLVVKPWRRTQRPRRGARRDAREIDDLRLPGRERDERTRAPFLEQVLSHAQLPVVVLEGEGGSGKSVLLQHVAYVLACRHLGRATPAHHLDLPSLHAVAGVLPVPMLFDARRVAQAAREHGPERALLSEIQRSLEPFGAPNGDDIRDGLRAGRYLVLVDALDEAPDAPARERVLHAVNAVARGGAASRLVVTTRPAAYTGVSLPAGLPVLPLAPMSVDDTERLIERWVSAQGRPASVLEDLRGAVAGVRERHGIDNIAENPLLLTCLLLVHEQYRRLPDSTAALYERMVAVLCTARDANDLRPEDRRQALEIVCRGIQEHGGTTRALADAARELRAWRPALASLPDAEEFVSRLALETGLLRLELGRSEHAEQRFVRPWHRSFQEYLAARAIAAGSESVADKTAGLFASRASGGCPGEDPAWEGVLRFLAGVYGDRSPDNARDYVAALRARLHAAEAPDGGPPREGRVLGLAAAVVAEYSEYFDGRHEAADLVAEIAAAFEARGARWPWRDRVLALEALGLLGDPRLSPAQRWVPIAAGQAVLGGDSKAYESLPRLAKPMGAFHVGRWPITVAEFEPFVKAGGYRDAGWWSDAEAPRVSEPGSWRRQQQHPNRPVTEVSWFEARAFCRWATMAGWAPSGSVVALPTEAEWEYAARGEGAHPYPWGRDDPRSGDDAQASYQWDGSDTPAAASPVGAFPAGHSPDGIWDLAGTVWEWCANIFDTTSADEDAPQDSQADGAAPRVVRGGSWGSPSGLLRLAVRLRSDPRDRSGHVGFRVVCRGSRPHA